MTEIRKISENLEVKKDGLAQLQDGSWVLKLKVHPNDMAVSLMQAPMGTRYIAALVEIGDDEQPVERAAEPAKKKRHMRDLPRSQQAALAADREAFRKFLFENGYASSMLPSEAVSATRLACGVASRSALDSNDMAAARWDSLYANFEAWLNEPEP